MADKAPVTPPPAAPAPAPAITTTAPKPAAEPRAARPPTPPAKPSIKPPESSVRKRPTITAKKALGMDETPRKEMESVLEEGRKRIAVTSPTTAEYKEPTVLAPPVAPAAPAEPEIPIEEPAAPITAALVAPTAPAKIKIGDKEYTPEELEALVKKSTAPAPVAAAPKAADQPAAPKPPTKEEIAAVEEKFVADTIAAMEAPLSEAEMDTILAGGKEAVEALTGIRKRDMANTVLQTRKSMASDLNPLFDQIFGALKPLVDNFQNVQRYTVEQQFVAKHPDFSTHVGTARSVAEELIRLYPDRCNQMSQDQFIDEVARQTDLILATEHRRWFPQGNGNWRTSAQPAPAAPAAPAAPVAVAPTAPVVPAPAAPQPTRVVRPPASTAPVMAGSPMPSNWHKSVTSSMR